MLITQVDIFSKPLNLTSGGYVMSSGAMHQFETAIVKITTDSKIVGWGECCPLGNNYDTTHIKGVIAALSVLAPTLIGQAVEPSSNFHNMESELVGNMSAKAAFDIALYDIVGKSKGIPCVDIFGSAIATQVPSYCAISVSAPEEAATTALEKVEAGFQRLQIKIGGRDIEDDIRTAKLCYAATSGKAELVLDANRGLTADAAIFISRALSEYDFILEQPCNSLEENLRIKSQLNHPLYLDENATDLATCERLISSGTCEGFGMKLTRIGGMQKMKAFSELCCAAGLPHTCDDSWGGDIIAAACVHIGASIDPAYLKGVWIAAPYIDSHYDTENGVKIVNGEITLPRGTGLGIQPDERLFGTPKLTFR